MYLEHQNNAYSRRGESYGGGNPFLCHPERVRFHQIGNLISDTLADGELVHAGTPFEVNLKNHSAKIMKIWEVVGVETAGVNTTLTLAAHWLAPKLAATDVVMVVPKDINAFGKGVVAGTVTDNGDGTVSITVVTANIDAVSKGDFLTIADAAAAPVKAGYYDAESGTEGALKVVAADATEGQINLADVTPYWGTKTLAANDYVVLKEEAEGASCKVKGNMISHRDLKAGNGQNLVDAPYGDFQCYVNLCNGIPAAVEKAAASEVGQIIVREYFAERASE